MRGCRTASACLRPCDDLAALYPPALLAESVRVAGARLLARRAVLPVPGRRHPAGLTPQAHLRELTEQGMARRWPGARTVRAQVEHELALIDELGYAACS